MDSKTGLRYPGPRCRTHHLAKKRERRVKTHGTRIYRTYGITQDEYDLILESQGGKCYVCRVATGASKSLAVDHDHKLEHLGHKSVRAIVCGHCNRDILGRLDVQGLLRAAEVLTNYPAQEILRRERGDDY